MQTANAARLIRVFCYLGALLDFGAAIQMLSPRLFAAMYGLTDFEPGADYRFAMGMGAPLMLGWTVLLLWVARRPIERSGVLVITVVPVVLGLAINELVAMERGFLRPGPVLPVLVLQLALSAAAIAITRTARRSSPGSAPNA